MTWVPTPERATDAVSPTAVAALHGLLDIDGDTDRGGGGGLLGAGEALPPLWHWLAFLPTVPQRDLGADGHPRTGGFLPPMGPGRRRMWAGGSLTFSGPLEIGAPIERVSKVTSVEEKSGRSGSLVFVTVVHELAGGRVVERQDIVYRDSGGAPGDPATPAAVADAEAGEEWTWEHTLLPDPTLLFRFSALTYNAHRIHYDRPYAMEVEGYPGLVVHGPLQAIALAELCRAHLPPDRELSSFWFRSQRPAFDANPLRLCGRRTGDDVTLVALDHHGQVTMRATATATGPT